MDEISLSTAMFLNSVMFFGICFFCNWHIRYTFVVAGYNRKGSYNRKLKKYKNNWSLLQRICLIPLLQESKSTVYKFLFVIDWLQFLMAWLTLIVIFLELSGKVLFFFRCLFILRLRRCCSDRNCCYFRNRQKEISKLSSHRMVS